MRAGKRGRSTENKNKMHEKKTKLLNITVDLTSSKTFLTSTKTFLVCTIANDSHVSSFFILELAGTRIAVLLVELSESFSCFDCSFAFRDMDLRVSSVFS